MSETETVRDTPTREHVAEEIRALLGRRRLSASELARMMGVSQPYLSRRLTGDVAIDVDDLALIARILGVQMTDLLPRSQEGRVLPTGAQATGERRQGITIRKFHPANRPKSNGHPKRTHPDPSTRRPARILPGHA